MKNILIIIFALASYFAQSQDSLKINQIDNIVSKINASTVPVKRDTIIQDVPQIGLKMTTYVTTIVNNQELIKYVNHVVGSSTENGVSQKKTGSNTFYFEHNKLIKVEEYLIEDDKKITADWYFSENKLLFSILRPDNGNHRAKLLLEIADDLVKQSLK